MLTFSTTFASGQDSINSYSLSSALTSAASPAASPTVTSARHKLRHRLHNLLGNLHTTRQRLHRLRPTVPRPTAGAGHPDQDVWDKRCVHPSVSRVPFQTTEREQRSIEDKECTAGLRNPVRAVRQWERLQSAMKPVRAALLAVRKDRPGLQRLHDACGSSPNRDPPSEKDLAEARRAVEAALNLPGGSAELHHVASPLRYRLFKALGTAAGDPDQSVPEWLEHGAPMGINVPVVPGGHFPRADRPPGVDAHDGIEAYRYHGNHPSFGEKWGEQEPPTLPLIRGYLKAGYGRVFDSQSSAEQYLGARCFPAPFGNVSKVRRTGRKHRIIQDLKACHINEAAGTWERIVLPRAVEHAVDLADLATFEGHVATLVLDFSDAFMVVPLHRDEMPYNCAQVPSLGPEGGPAFVVWQVLGFGGKANPLVFGRIGSWAARYGQAVMDCSRTRLQLYIDDPTVVAAGDLDSIHAELDILLLLWLVLGFRLSWKKGSYVESASRPAPMRDEHPILGPIGLPQDEVVHEWIGVQYALRGSVAVMGLSDEYAETTREALAPFLRRSGIATIAQARTAVGKSSRVAQVVPAATPFVASLWAALTAALRAEQQAAAEAPPGHAAVVRFFAAAAWMDALLRAPQGSSRALFPQCRQVRAHGDGRTFAQSNLWIEFDASPWGGGAVLRSADRCREYFFTTWDEGLFKQFGAACGDPKWQSLWELATLLLSLIIWGEHAVDCVLMIHGDNVAALHALSLKGKGDMNAVAREISWRKARFFWEFDVHHIPSEQNHIADALSRLSAVHASAFPSDLVRMQAWPGNAPRGQKSGWCGWRNHHSRTPDVGNGTESL